MATQTQPQEAAAAEQEAPQPQLGGRRFSLPHVTTAFTLKQTHSVLRLHSPVVNHHVTASNKLARLNQQRTIMTMHKDNRIQSPTTTTAPPSSSMFETNLSKHQQRRYATTAGVASPSLASKKKFTSRDQIFTFDATQGNGLLQNVLLATRALLKPAPAAATPDSSSATTTTTATRAEQIQDHWRKFSSAVDAFVQSYGALMSMADTVAMLDFLSSQGAVFLNSNNNDKHAVHFEKISASILRAYYTSMYMKNGEQALRQYNQTIVLIKQLAKQIDPVFNGYNYMIYFLRGLSDFQLGNNDHAIDNFSKSIQDEAEFPYSYINRAFSLYASEQQDVADVDFDKSLQLDPSHKDECYLSRGLFYHYTWKKPHNALEDFSHAIDANKLNYAAYLCRARLLAEDFDDPENAVKDFDKAIEINPTLIVAYTNRAMLNFELLNRPDLALEDYNTVLKLNPDNNQALVKKGQILCEVKNDADGAIAVLNKAIELSPSDPMPYCLRAIANGKLKGNSAEALKDFDTAIKMDPEMPDAYNDRGWLYLELTNEYEKALTDFSRAIELNKQFTVAFNNRGLTYRALKRNVEALRDFTTAIELDPFFVMSYMNRASLYAEEMNNPDAAVKDLSKAIKQIPDDPQLYMMRSLIYSQGLGDEAKATADLQKARQLQGQTTTPEAVQQKQ